MEILVLAVGKLRPYYRAAADDYVTRLGRYARLSEAEVREAARAPTPARQLEQEGERLLERIPPAAHVVALTRDGRSWTSRDLAGQVERWLGQAQPVALAIGGSIGLGPAVLSRSNVQWSLGPLTLPHELARVIVYEQLYRAFTILRGEPYHKGR